MPTAKAKKEAKSQKESQKQKKEDLVGKFLDASSELTDLIRSRHPIIYVESNEAEKTILSIINDICGAGTKDAKYKRNLYIWDVANGMTQREFGKRGPEVVGCADQVKDPGAVLEYIMSNATQREQSACYVLCEFHHYLETPNIQRRLRNFAEITASKERKTIILLSPKNRGMSDGKRVPPELENIVHLFDWPLPDEEVIRTFLEEDIIPSINNAFKKQNYDEMDFSEEDLEVLIDSMKGLTLSEGETAAYTSAIKKRNLEPEIILKSKKQIIRKSGLVEYIEPDEESLEEVGGILHLKNWLDQRRPILSDDARDFGCDTPNGIMLIGPWGTGKSSVAKSIINTWGLPGLRIDAAKLMESFVGSSERNTASALQLAETVAPCILWWDEVDDLFSGAESSAQSDGGTTSRVIGIISTWMSEHKGTVFNIFTANDVSRRPPKLFRKGRIDEIFIVDLPVREEREEIFRIHIDKRRGKGFSEKMKIDLKELAKRSTMFSGAEIREAVNSGFIQAYNADKREIETKDILQAVDDTIPISCTMKEQLVEMRKWQDGRAVRASEYSPEDIIDMSEYRKTSKPRADVAAIEI